MRSIEDLVEPLSKMTEGGKLPWTEKNPNTFVIGISDCEVHVWNWTSEASGADGVSARLLNREGEVLDEVSADEFRPRYLKLKALFDNARRSARKVEAAVTDIERQLRSVAAL